MPRPRHQEGWLSLENGKWVGHWKVYIKVEDKREVRRNREKVIGPKSEYAKHEAKKELAKLISRDPAVSLAKPDPRVTLEWFWNYRYKPLAESSWRESTQKSFPYIVEKHIMSRFGHFPLCHLDGFSLQDQVNTLAKKYSRSLVLHVRKLARMILGKAVELEFLEKNPAAKLAVPKKLREQSERYLSFDEIRILDEGLKGRERLIFRMFVLLGLRPGELFARRWCHWQGNILIIKDAVYRGLIEDPKTKMSKGFVYLPPMLQRDLAIHRTKFEHLDDNDFIFQAVHGKHGVPLDTHNYLRRVLKTACDALGVKDVTHQCLRRTCSTHIQPYGNIKDVQAHLRHADARTTLGIYVKAIPESVKRAVDEMSSKLFPPESSIF